MSIILKLHLLPAGPQFIFRAWSRWTSQARERENLARTSKWRQFHSPQDKKRPQFLTSRPRVTDLFLQDVNHNKETSCTRLYKVRRMRRGLWELPSWRRKGKKEHTSTAEVQDHFPQRCQDMTHSSPNCNHWMPERGNMQQRHTVKNVKGKCFRGEWSQ